MSVTRPTRALKEFYKMDKTVVKATMGSVLSNMSKKHSAEQFCTTKKLQKDAKAMCIISREIDIGLCPIFFCGF